MLFLLVFIFNLNFINLEVSIFDIIIFERGEGRFGGKFF